MSTNAERLLYHMNGIKWFLYLTEHCVELGMRMESQSNKIDFPIDHSVIGDLIWLLKRIYRPIYK